MERVTGVGGVFIKARNPAALAAWYRDHHWASNWRLEATPWQPFRWAEAGTTTWSAFPDHT